MRGIILITSAAYNQIIRSSFYLLLLLLMVAGVFFSQFVTFFEFGRDVNLLREISFSTIFLWSLLCSILGAQIVISEELENKISYTILTKPISPAGFITGKLIGVSLSVILGILLLCSTMFYTIWLKYGKGLITKYQFSLSQTFWEHMEVNFFNLELRFLMQVLLLSCFTAFLLSSISVFCFTTLSQNMAFMTTIFVSLLSQAIHLLIKTGIVMPMLVVFQLPTAISQGETIAVKYLVLSTFYLISYLIFIVSLNTIIFSKKNL